MNHSIDFLKVVDRVVDNQTGDFRVVNDLGAGREFDTVADEIVFQLLLIVGIVDRRTVQREKPGFHIVDRHTLRSDHHRVFLNPVAELGRIAKPLDRVHQGLILNQQRNPLLIIDRQAVFIQQRFRAVSRRHRSRLGPHLRRHAGTTHHIILGIQLGI